MAQTIQNGLVFYFYTVGGAGFRSHLLRYYYAYVSFNFTLTHPLEVIGFCMHRFGMVLE